jgi:putative toxin-antitoxin system antitoxin component (TIGR02293 family)
MRRILAQAGAAGQCDRRLAEPPNIVGKYAKEPAVASAEAAGALGGISRRRTVPLDLALANAVREGLPISALDRLIASGIVGEDEVEARFIPRRTLYARRQKGTLSREQSDIVVRLARIQTTADEVFGDRRKSHSWLRRPNGALDGQVPLSVLDTEEGGRRVEAVLGRIAHGIVE